MALCLIFCCVLCPCLQLLSSLSLKVSFIGSIALQYGMDYWCTRQSAPNYYDYMLSVHMDLRICKNIIYSGMNYFCHIYYSLLEALVLPDGPKTYSKMYACLYGHGDMHKHMFVFMCKDG